jgi:hypothetical protein
MMLISTLLFIWKSIRYKIKIKNINSTQDANNRVIDDRMNAIDARFDQLARTLQRTSANGKRDVQPHSREYDEQAFQGRPECMTSNSPRSSTPEMTTANQERFKEQWSQDYSPQRGDSYVQNNQPSAPNKSIHNDSTFYEPSRQIRFDPFTRRHEAECGPDCEPLIARPFLFVPPPEKFDPRKTDVKQWIKDLDMFIQANNIRTRRINIALPHLDHETRKMVESTQLGFDEDTEYHGFKKMLMRLYEKKQTPSSELRRQFAERIQQQS